MGYSGAGKTSFVNLILNLYSVQAGAVKIDNQPVDTIPLDILYSSISMITQDCYRLIEVWQIILLMVI